MACAEFATRAARAGQRLSHGTWKSEVEKERTYSQNKRSRSADLSHQELGVGSIEYAQTHPNAVSSCPTKRFSVVTCVRCPEAGDASLSLDIPDLSRAMLLSLSCDCLWVVSAAPYSFWLALAFPCSISKLVAPPRSFSRRCALS